MYDAFGFDFANHKAKFYDDGATRMSVSTLERVGRSIAALLSLPAKSEGSGPSLEDYRDREVHVASFTVSQQDIFGSILRITGDRREDWAVEYEPAAERFTSGAAAVQAGDKSGFAHMLISRNFYPLPGVGNREKHYSLINEALGLDTESIDNATRRAIKLAEAGGPWVNRKP